MASEQIDFASDDSLLDQFKTIFITQLQCALDQLGQHLQTAKIHGARKALKRARATLRLLRPAIGKEAYRLTNVALRDAARPLSKARDAQVLDETLHKLLCRFDESLGGIEARKIEKFLSRESSRAKRSTHQQHRLAPIRDALSTVKSRARRWKFNDNKASVAFDAARRSYSRVRKARRAALEQRSTELLHEWRKQTKYLWHQIQVLEPLAPGELGTYADSLHRLSDYLGDDHDLAVLRSTVFDSHSTMTDEISRVLKALIDTRRAQLQVKAFALGDSLLRKRPKRWRGNLRRYWEVQTQRRRYAVRVATQEQEELAASQPPRAERHQGAPSTLH